MSADDFQQLLKQLNYGLAEIEQQKKGVNNLTHQIKHLEQHAGNDVQARKQLQALQQYQQSDRFMKLREKAEKELALLQQQCGQMQQAVAKDAMPATPQPAKAVLPVTPVTTFKKHHYI
jgi:protein subunit release factor A